MATRGFRSRINEKCRDCVYDPANRGNWREQVYLCTVESCALWDIRPKPSNTKRADRIAAEDAA